MTPFADPVVIDERGVAFLPDPEIAGVVVPHSVHRGCGLGWAPMQGAVLVNVLCGARPKKGKLRESIAFTLTRPGLRALIEDLQAIEAHCEGSPHG